LEFPLNLHTGRVDEHISQDRILRDDTKFASGKIAFFQYVMVGVFLFLLTGFWDLQIRNPELYQ
jgi:penicillin-binding protein 2